MNIFRIALPVLVGLLLALAPQDASAQLRRLIREQIEHQIEHQIQPRYTPGYHIDNNNRVIRDSHGHVIGRYHHDVVRRNSIYIVPHTSHPDHHGTYFADDGAYYYAPHTGSGGGHGAPQPAQVRFGGFSHVEDLAGRLETLSNEFCLDLHYNYSHNRGFKETYAEAYRIRQVAQYIHSAEHRDDRNAIRSELSGVDKLFHHVRDDVRGWTRQQHRQIGQLGLPSKMDMIESTLRHLMNDVGVRPTQGPEQAPAPGGGTEQAPAPSVAPEQAPAPTP